MTHRLWVLGAPDPEMEAIEQLLRECGEQVAYAQHQGHRVDAGSAYRCDPVPDGTHWVECESPGQVRGVVIDHHRPGDPGYGRPPAEFLPASSVGQVIAALAATPYSERGPMGHWVSAWLRASPGRGGRLTFSPPEWRVSVRGQVNYASWVTIPPALVFAAAADHCLAAAYRGECLGVDPDALMRWRVESRAAFQRRDPSAILADIERARAAIRAAPTVALLDVCDMPHVRDHDWSSSVCEGCMDDPVTARDLRGQHVPELPEASAREGECVVADGLPGRDGRTKVICQSGSPDQIETFMILWGPDQGLTDIYGDPARGFAGGYLPAPAPPVEARQ